MGWSPEGRVDNGQKGQRGAVSNQILPAPGDEQRLGVYQMDGMRDVSVNSLPIDLIIHCWQVQLKQLFKVIFLLCLFLVVLGLPCCAWAFSSCGEWGLLFVAVYQLLIAVASLVSEHGL